MEYGGFILKKKSGEVFIIPSHLPTGGCREWEKRSNFWPKTTPHTKIVATGLQVVQFPGLVKKKQVVKNQFSDVTL